MVATYVTWNDPQTNTVTFQFDEKDPTLLIMTGYSSDIPVIYWSLKKEGLPAKHYSPPPSIKSFCRCLISSRI